MLPHVSVVIPTHRRPELLAVALQSVTDAWVAAGNPGGGIEIIVVDDGHDEATRVKCAEYGDKGPIALSYQRSIKGPRAGPAHCRNQGIRGARGEFIYLLDDDDRFLPNRFEVSLQLLSQGKFDVVLEPTRRAFIDAPHVPSYVTGPYGNPDNAFRFLMEGSELSHVTPGASAFRKAVFDSAGGYDESLRYGEDGELLLRLCLFGRVALVGGDPVVQYSIHGDNSSRPEYIHISQSVRMLACLYQKLILSPWRDEAAYVKHELSCKLDYALSESRRMTRTYPARLADGAKALRHFDWRCTSLNNLKSIAVWLTKGPHSGPGRHVA